MRSVIILFAFAACLVFTGCSKDESQTASPQTSEPAAKPADTAKVVKQAEQAVEQAKEKVVEVTEQVKEKVAEMTVQTREKVAAVTTQAKEKAAEVTEQAEEKVTQVKSQAQNLLGAVPGSLTTASSSISGEAIYTKSCSSCHKSGIMGAPKTGDKSAWAELISGGIDQLEKNSINGIGKMPARGGNSQLTDDEVKAAVNYMVEEGQ